MNVQTSTLKTAEGKAYVEKVTHPPGQTTDYAGVPDTSAPNAVLMELKADVNISIKYLEIDGAQTPTVSPNYSSGLLFLQPSGGYIGNYVFHLVGQSWVQPLDLPQQAQPTPTAVTLSGYDWSNAAHDIAQYRTTYKSSTYYLNATDFTNQGTVVTAKFKPKIIRTDKFLGMVQNMSSEQVEKIKSDFSVEALDQFQWQILDLGRLADGSVTTTDANLPNSAFLNNVLPSTPSQLLTFSPKAVVRVAREGAFVVQQPIQSYQPWMDYAVDYSQVPTAPSKLVVSGIGFVDKDSVYKFVPLRSNSGTGSQAVADSPWNNLDFSLTMFTGMTVPTNNSTTFVGEPYVTVKNIYGMEVQVEPSSSLVSFARVLPMPDGEALSMASAIFHARPDSLPASANDFGTIASVLTSVLPEAWKLVKGLFSHDSKSEKKPKDKESSPEKLSQIVRHLTEAVQRSNRLIRPATQQRAVLNKTLDTNQRVPRHRSSNMQVKLSNQRVNTKQTKNKRTK